MAGPSVKGTPETCGYYNQLTKRLGKTNPCANHTQRPDAETVQSVQGETATEPGSPAKSLMLVFLPATLVTRDETDKSICK